jgi:hypothetical protein
MAITVEYAERISSDSNRNIYADLSYTADSRMKDLEGRWVRKTNDSISLSRETIL